MDYHPNILASTLASKKIVSFAILFPNPQSEESYWNKPMEGVRKAFNELQQFGIKISVFRFSQTEASSFVHEARKILDGKFDGVVLAPFFSREAKNFIRELSLRNIPFVFIDSNLKECEKLSYVGQNSYQSGALSARLLDFSIPGPASILILHFAKEMDNQNHLMQREKGFYEYFEQNDPEKQNTLITLEIENPTDKIFFSTIDRLFSENQNIMGIFVTNSQVYRIAEYLEARNRADIRLIGHDLIRENAEYLKKGIVDFLICQRPEEQGYQAVNALFEHVIMKKQVKNENFTSIDIVTKENLDYYK
jgi:LacI family transcriptional regulator